MKSAWARSCSTCSPRTRSSTGPTCSTSACSPAGLARPPGGCAPSPAAAETAVGYFGASTGAAASLWSAAEPGASIAAVVFRGGRPDLARPRLAAVPAPTLLIVGGRDETVLDLNRRAQAELRCENHLAVVPGATHLFEEPGTLDSVAGLARDWFVSHMAHSRDPVARQAAIHPALPKPPV